MGKLRAAAIGLAVMSLSACGADDDDSFAAVQEREDAAEAAAGEAVTGEVKEWSVSLSRPVAEAGAVTFQITNKGTMAHEFLVVRTDYPDGEIPLKIGRAHV